MHEWLHEELFAQCPTVLLPFPSPLISHIPLSSCSLVQVLPAPANYNPVIDPAKKLMATPTPSFTPFYAMPEDNPSLKADLPVAPEGLPEMKPEDMQYFGKLLQVRRT